MILNILFLILGFLCCAEYYARVGAPLVMIRELLNENSLLNQEMGKTEGYRDGVVDAVKKLCGGNNETNTGD